MAFDDDDFVDINTFVQWSDAIIAALRRKSPDYSQLVARLRDPNKVVHPDLREFLAWMIECRVQGKRSKMPMKFQRLKKMGHRLFWATLEFHQLRSEASNDVGFEQTLKKVAVKHDVPTDQLRSEVRRGLRSKRSLLS